MYTEDMKEISLLIFLKGGPSTYSLLCEVLPLPSLSSVRQDLGSMENVIEGQLRVQELKGFLLSNNLPLDIWLSEDATRCITQVCFVIFLNIFAFLLNLK